MKAKTKVLVGLLVVLAMMMFASPAMAQSDTTFTATIIGTISNDTTTVEVGNPIGLQVVEPTATTLSRQWQISKKDAERPEVLAYDPEDTTEWENIDGATKTTLDTVATMDMDGRWLRCVVNVDGKKIVATQNHNNYDVDSPYVRLKVENTAEITKGKPTKDLYTMDPVKAEYTGKTQRPTITPAEGAGEVDKVSYYLGDKAVNGEPTEVGSYTVKIDTKASDNYEAAEDLELGTFEITKGKPTKELYTMDPVKAEYTGKTQRPTITPAEGAGEVDKVSYYLGDKAVNGEPTEVGSYTVKIDTKANDNYEAAEDLELGTFTIIPEKSEQPTIYTIGHVENIGWGSDGKGKLEELKPGGTVDMGTTGRGLRVEAMSFIVPEDYKVVGFAHVENEGDVAVKEVKSSKDYKIPEGYVAYEFGSTGKGQRVEAVCVGLQDASGEYVKGFQYAVHLQNYGWQGFVRNGSFSGTRGMGLRMESIRFTYSEDDIVKPGEPK